MIWDSNTQAFVESEIPLTYNPQLDAWQETEGLVYNPVLGALQKVWPEISAYVYGAANETIAIARNGITVATVQTNTNGRTDEQVYLSRGTYTLTGSVSGWTETQEVASDTDRLRAMPEGALYWHGNECTDITGGWNVAAWATGPNGSQNLTKYPTYMQAYSTTYEISYATRSTPAPVNAIDLTGYSKIKAQEMSVSVSGSEPNALKSICVYNTNNTHVKEGPGINNEINNMVEVEVGVSELVGKYKTALIIGWNRCTQTTNIYKVWMEK